MVYVTRTTAGDVLVLPETHARQLAWCVSRSPAPRYVGDGVPPRTSGKKWLVSLVWFLDDHFDFFVPWILYLRSWRTWSSPLLFGGPVANSTASVRKCCVDCNTKLSQQLHLVQACTPAISSRPRGHPVLWGLVLAGTLFARQFLRHWVSAKVCQIQDRSRVSSGGSNVRCLSLSYVPSRSVRCVVESEH